MTTVYKTDPAELEMKSACRPMYHIKARCQTYPRYPDIVRHAVPDEKLTWDVMYPDYAPVDFTAPSVAKRPIWADPDYKYIDICQH